MAIHFVNEYNCSSNIFCVMPSMSCSSFVRDVAPKRNRNKMIGFHFPLIMSCTNSKGQVYSVLIFVNNFMSCHRFNLIRCHKSAHFPVMLSIAYTIVLSYLFASSQDSVSQAAA